MSISKGILFASLLSFSAHVRAEDCLNNLPPSIRAAVEQDNWTILQPQDLAGTDPQRWKGNHPGECPGVTSGNFYPKGKTSYLLALIQRNPAQAGEQTSQLEQLTLVYLKKNSPVTVSVIPPTQVAAPMVVWKLHPGSYQNLYGSKKVTISRESFVYEKLVGTANQFYYDGSHLKSLVLSK
ncbi:hypothetical protein [Tunturibacter empetritectus]|uniref:Uncharacterized protein n=1 Tax=Tunturiibacter empetritectus TaxID=3069691 RepID=A0A7W8MR60_9BACT|nr:hypothetical protein [Edaphobacter lichenicola]MBB5316932.1 hypothetical protein [Edaphobacter lichenicola]